MGLVTTQIVSNNDNFLHLLWAINSIGIVSIVPILEDVAVINGGVNPENMLFLIRQEYETPVMGFPFIAGVDVSPSQSVSARVNKGMDVSITKMESNTSLAQTKPCELVKLNLK